MALPVAVASLLLIPLAIFAGFAFLLAVGAIALGLALGLISAVTWLIRTPVQLLTGRRSA